MKNWKKGRLCSICKKEFQVGERIAQNDEGEFINNKIKCHLGSM